MRDDVRKVVLHMLELFAGSDYAEIERMCGGIRLSATDMATAIADYGCEVVIPPEGACDYANVVEVKDQKLPQWSIQMPLFTKEEGCSDLTVEMTIIDEGGNLLIEIDDLHVL